MVLHDIAWYCMVLHGIAWYCTILHYLALSCTILHQGEASEPHLQTRRRHARVKTFQWRIGRVWKSKKARNFAHCFFNVLWCIESEGIFLFAKKYFRLVKLDPKFRIFLLLQVLHCFLSGKKSNFLTMPSMSIVIWNPQAKSIPMVPRC